MPIAVACLACGNEIKAPDNWAGQKAKCPKCGKWLVISVVDAAPAARLEPRQEGLFRKKRSPSPDAAATGRPSAGRSSGARSAADPGRRRLLVGGALGGLLLLAAAVVVWVVTRPSKEEEAIKALSAIKAATEGGMSLDRYAGLLDAKGPELDTLLDRLPDGEVRTNLIEAWDDYRKAAVMWRARPETADVSTRACWARASRWLERARACLAGGRVPPPPASVQDLVKEEYDRPLFAP